MAPSPSAPSDAHDPSSGDAVHHPPAGHDHAATSSECDEAVAEIYAFLDGELDPFIEAYLMAASGGTLRKGGAVDAEAEDA